MKIWPIASIITVVLVVTVGLLVVLPQTNWILPKPSPTAQPGIPKPIVTMPTQVTLAPQVAEVKVGSTAIYAIYVEAGNLKVQGVETVLTYDPNSLEVISVEPGPFFTQPDILRKSIDAKNGKVAFALGSLQAASGNSPVFIVQVKTKLATAGGSGGLKIDKANTKIALVSADTKTHYMEEETVATFNEKPLTILP